MIEIVQLQHAYPDGTVSLKGIDLTIEDGEFWLICGPNGSGKSTLIRLIAGLLKAKEGSIRINGFETTTNSLETRKQVGMVFQEADSQIVGETVREDVAFGPENLGWPREEIERQVEWALRMMDLQRVSEKPCDLLSGGEKRRLAVAGILAMNPRTLLLDEPFSHLDYLGIREVLKHLVDLHRRGHTVVVTTHDVEKVMAHVDRVAILHQGQLRKVGSPQEVMSVLPHFGVRPPCYALAGGGKISWLDE